MLISAICFYNGTVSQAFNVNLCTLGIIVIIKSYFIFKKKYLFVMFRSNSEYLRQVLSISLFHRRHAYSRGSQSVEKTDCERFFTGCMCYLQQRSDILAHCTQLYRRPRTHSLLAPPPYSAQPPFPGLYPVPNLDAAIAEHLVACCRQGSIDLRRQNQIIYLLTSVFYSPHSVY